MVELNSLHYTTEHEWLSVDGDTVTVGITDYAADKLGDVVFVDLPQLGARLLAGAVCGEIESTKSVGELYSPVNGEVIAVNDQLSDRPELVNSDPFGEGWLIKVTFTELGAVLDRAAYQSLTAE